MQHPVAREILADAHLIEGDVHWRKDLAYSSSRFAGDGFVLVGDAAAFIDPFYSPGMDWISFTAACAAQLITTQRRGDSLAEPLDRHNKAFTQSYRAGFAVYQDKYEYMGEYDLMRLAFLMDLGLYYLGIVLHKPFKMGMKGLLAPPFSEPLSRTVFALDAHVQPALRQDSPPPPPPGPFSEKQNRAHRFLANGFT